ncbi:nuclear transport factor 2 family protein [Actinoallomurus vinaceus]|uniref:Nuclear transport factor 2 family protein n=1 Tax=Actinoallomurus vinaceus TaxID=1080074 RepID=A0ABP8UTP8_9ACTN
MEGPLEVLERRRRLLVEGDIEAFADLFAVDGVIEMPFAVDGIPARLEGREAIREFSARAATMPFEIIDLRTVQFHQTADPEVVIVEIESVARVTTTGETFEAPCIQVFRIRDGRILLFRDYVGAHSVPDLAAS